MSQERNRDTTWLGRELERTGKRSRDNVTGHVLDDFVPRAFAVVRSCRSKFSFRFVTQSLIFVEKYRLRDEPK